MRFPIVLAATMLVVSLQAQSPTTFEVASIKPNKSGAPGSETDTSPGRVSVINATPLSLLLRAFGVSAFQVAGAPDWVRTERYDVVATVPDGRVLNDQDRGTEAARVEALAAAATADLRRGRLGEQRDGVRVERPDSVRELEHGQRAPDRSALRASTGDSPASRPA